MQGPEEEVTASLPNGVEFPIMARADDGTFIVFSARCSPTKGEIPRNAHVFGKGGEHGASFHAGDGIEDVQADRQGRFWVSYFDEGVFDARRMTDPCLG